MRFIKTAIFIICILISSLFFITGITVVLTQRNIPAFIFFYVIGGAILSIGIFINKKTKREKENLLIKEEDKRQKINEREKQLKLTPGSLMRIKELEARICIETKHISGLPIAQDASIYIYLCKDKIMFERNEKTFNLEFNKIQDITIKTDNEIQKAYVSSIGGAVAGGVLFGPLGAIIGGRTKEKTTQTINKYLIFTYDKNDAVDFISFDVTGESKAYEFVNYFAKIRSIERVDRKEINL